MSETKWGNIRVLQTLVDEVEYFIKVDKHHNSVSDFAGDALRKELARLRKLELKA